MRALLLLVRRLLRRRRPAPQPPPIDPERLQRIYRETHREVRDLRDAA